MKKNSLESKKYLVNILIDHKIIYRETDKSIIVPFENGGNVDREPIWFKNFRINQEAFNEKVTTFMNKQEVFNKKQEVFNEKVDKRLTNIENRLDSLEYKVDAILECPTIQKEIKL